MKKRILSLLLVVMMLLAVMPVTAFAAAEEIVVDNATYYDTGELKSFKATFDWTTGTVNNSRLVLMTNRLKGEYPGSGVSGYGDFTNFGAYSSSFTKFDQVLAKDNTDHTFGIISYSDNISSIGWGQKDFSVSFSFDKDDLPLNVNKTYYLYLWVTYSGQFYPDNLICAIQIQDGQVKYSPAIESDYYRNHYNPQSFKAVVKEGHTCQPTTAWQKDASGHWHVACQDVTCANNLVKADEAQHVYSNNTDTDCNSCGYVRTINNNHNHLKSDWLWDDNGHWRRGCQDANCANFQTKVDAGKHVYTDDYDSTCNSCGYTRTAPAQHPETGDITNIPLWTAIFVGGMALLWIQMEQRKRAQF